MAKKKEKRPRGRPSGFNQRIAERIIAVAQQEGMTDPKIADAVGISLRTLELWKAKHPDLLRAIEASKAVADEVVEMSLFRKATGYSQPAVKIHYDSDSGLFVTHEYIEHFPPDTVAIQFWLKNRRGKKWRDKTETEHTGKVTLEELVAGSMEPKK